MKSILNRNSTYGFFMTVPSIIKKQLLLNKYSIISRHNMKTFIQCENYVKNKKNIIEGSILWKYLTKRNIFEVNYKQDNSSKRKKYWEHKLKKCPVLLRKLHLTYILKNGNINWKFYLSKGYLFYYLHYSHLFLEVNLSSIIFKIFKFFLLIGLLYAVYSKYKEVMKSYILEKVLLSDIVINEISKSLIIVVNKPGIKLLMSESLCKLLDNEGFKKDTYNLVEKLLIDFLKSKDCYNLLLNLLIKDILNNEQVKFEIFSLIKDILVNKKVDFLEKKLEEIIVSILNKKEIHFYVKKALQQEFIESLKNESILKLAIKTLLEKV